MLSAGRSEIILALRIAHASVSELQLLSNSMNQIGRLQLHFKIKLKLPIPGQSGQRSPPDGACAIYVRSAPSAGDQMYPLSSVIAGAAPVQHCCGDGAEISLLF